MIYYINAGSLERRSTGSLHTKRLGCRKDNFRNRHCTVQWDCRGLRGRRTNSTVSWGRRIVFSGSDHSIIYLYWDWRGRTSSGIAASSSIDRSGLLGQRFWGRWTSSSRLELRQNITSGVAEHYRRLGLGGHRFWGRCTIVIWIAGTYAPPGVVPAFRHDLLCRSTTRLLCTGRGRNVVGCCVVISVFLVNKLNIK